MPDTENKSEENYFYNKYKRREFKFSSSSRLKFLALIIVVFAFCYWLTASAPNHFLEKKVVSIPAGSSLSSISEILYQSSIIRSPMMFRMAVRFFAGQGGVKAGEYLFESPKNVIAVAKRLTEGNRGFELITVVIPEGTSVSEIGDILGAKIQNFDKKKFVEIAKKHEGYLFPDTYNFDFDVTPAVVLDVMLANFNKRIETLQNEINNFKRPLSEIVNMASIVEEEGRTTETRRIVAGILWKRLNIEMPLQVDAAFQYINGKTTFELATSDLIADVPYNTYTRKGLPPTPITNPGLDSILATVTPIKTSYLFYLTDKNGVMRYAATHEGHLVNKEKYLK